MRTIPFSELHKVDFTLSDILAFPQFWHDGSVYSFAERARPNHGVMFFTGSSAVYTGSDGSRCAEASPTDVVYVPKGVRYTVAFSGNDDKAGTSNYLINFILTDKNGEEFALSDGVTVYSEAFSDTLCDEICTAVEAVDDGVSSAVQGKGGALRSIVRHIAVASRRGDTGDIGTDSPGDDLHCRELSFERNQCEKACGDILYERGEFPACV